MKGTITLTNGLYIISEQEEKEGHSNTSNGNIVKKARRNGTVTLY